MNIIDDSDLDALLAELYAGALTAPILERIFEGIADYDTSFELINRYSTDNPHHALGFCAGQWFETTQAGVIVFLVPRFPLSKSLITND